ncbi:BREX system P-loop protein BrxC, partial [Pseudomonas aeruginosa]
ADAKPWQGNRLQQARQQLEALQLVIANQLASEQKASEQLLNELEQRLQGAESYAALNSEHKQQLSAPFAQARQKLKGQKLIAVIRDQRSRFEDEQYPQLLLKLDQLVRPQPAPTEPPAQSSRPERSEKPGADSPEQPKLKVAEPRIVQSRHIKVGYTKPWLASEAELDDYLRKQREAWLKEIQAGNRVQI